MSATDQYSLADLLYLMARLRDPEGGCPWDLQQDFASIVPHTLEEAYEVADAIERQDFAHLPSELGDLLFQVVYYSQLGDEQQ
ncbi:MAG: nucleoside triphosphate pyrophosphohydrolase, partial [Gammaproteobacteria bacterium]|nr:nucleoside triphosphate pyrophosphohydrolase [Gammaproteobacteria bacterium]